MEILLMLLVLVIWGFPWIGVPAGMFLTGWSCCSSRFRKRAFITGSIFILLSAAMLLFLLAQGATAGSGLLFPTAREGTGHYLASVYWTYGFLVVLMLYFVCLMFLANLSAEKSARRYPRNACVILLLLLVGAPIVNSVGVDHADPRTLSGAFNPRVFLAFMNGQVR